MDGVDGDKGDKGDKGDPGTPGEKGDPGPSNAYADGPNTDTFGSNAEIVASVTVPAGSYVVSASLRAINTNSTPRAAQCNVGTGPPVSSRPTATTKPTWTPRLSRRCPSPGR